jgi:hypothetical protein
MPTRTKNPTRPKWYFSVAMLDSFWKKKNAIFYFRVHTSPTQFSPLPVVPTVGPACLMCPLVV